MRFKIQIQESGDITLIRDEPGQIEIEIVEGASPTAEIRTVDEGEFNKMLRDRDTNLITFDHKRRRFVKVRKKNGGVS